MLLNVNNSAQMGHRNHKIWCQMDHDFSGIFGMEK